MFELAAVNWDVLFAPQNFVFVAVFGVGGVIAIIGILAGSWAGVQKHRQEVQLKRDLVARGYSVDEIERIIKTQPGKR